MISPRIASLTDVLNTNADRVHRLEVIAQKSIDDSMNMCHVRHRHREAVQGVA